MYEADELSIRTKISPGLIDMPRNLLDVKQNPSIQIRPDWIDGLLHRRKEGSNRK
jgi:hypothetical protein